MKNSKRELALKSVIIGSTAGYLLMKFLNAKKAAKQDDQVIIGFDPDTKKSLILSKKDMSLHSSIIGAVGAGKVTSCIFPFNSSDNKLPYSAILSPGEITIGQDIKTNKDVNITHQDRIGGTMIVGSTGTGMLALPNLNQDLNNMTSYINTFAKFNKPQYLKKPKLDCYLNGISVISPTNDLCHQTLQLVKAHGIPDEAITYINPLDPDTPAINAMPCVNP